MQTNEAQVDEGQVKVAAVEADVTGLSEQDIAERIDNDASFAKAYMEGRIKDNSEPKSEGEVDAEAEAEVQTPTDQPSEGGAEPEPKANQATEDEPIFTIKRGELPEGFDTPGKVFKSHAAKQEYIERIQNQVSQRDSRITQLEAELRAEREAKAKADAEQVSAAETVDNEIEEEKLYDPEYMKSQLKRIQKMDSLEKELNDLKKVVSDRDAKEVRKESVQRELKQLQAFQSQYPVLRTSKSFQEIDSEYSEFVEGIKAITGVEDTQEALKYVTVYLNDKGEDGNNLRAAAARANVKAPDELDPYLKVMRIRETAQRVVNIDPVTKQPMQLSLEEAFRMTYPELYVRSGSTQQPPTKKPVTEAERKAAEQEAQRIAALNLQNETATDIKPSDSGTGETVDDLSDEQIDELFNMTPEQLRANPRKKKLLDDVYKRLKMPALSVTGNPDATI